MVVAGRMVVVSGENDGGEWREGRRQAARRTARTVVAAAAGDENKAVSER